MKKNAKFLIFFLTLCPSLFCQSITLNSKQSYEIKKNSNQKIKILIIPLEYCEKQNSVKSEPVLKEEEFCQLIQILKKCLEISGQCQITVKKSETAPKKINDICLWSKSGYQYVIYLKYDKLKKSLFIRLYDTIDGKMLTGKKLSGLKVVKSKPLKGFYSFIQDLWLDLMGQKGPYESLISYIKRNKNSKSDQESIFCLCTPDGYYHKNLVSLPGAYVGLYWHPVKPRLYCSEFARYNVRLVSLDLQGNKRIVLDRDGTSAGISLDPKTNRVAYCRSGSIWLYEHKPENNKSYHRKLISNDGKNMYPILLSNGDIIFCSDSLMLKEKTNVKTYGRRKIPSIYIYKSTNRSIEPLVTEGYAISPAYCDLTDNLAFIKKINGVFQLFVCNLNDKSVKQLTFDPGNKVDPSWSNCGNYLVFAHQNRQISRIAFINQSIGQRSYLTSEKDYCISPAWSTQIW